VEWGKKGRKEYYCLFARKGFTEAMLKRAREEKVFLFNENEPLQTGERQVFIGPIP